MKIFLFIAAAAMFLLSGCYSNFTGHMLYARKTLTVVTPDGIQENKVYEIDDKYYAKATVRHYKVENNIFRYVFSVDDYTHVSSDSDKWVSIPQEIPKYSENAAYTDVSNFLLEIACEAGIFALVLLLYLFWVRLVHRSRYRHYVYTWLIMH